MPFDITVEMKQRFQTRAAHRTASQTCDQAQRHPAASLEIQATQIAKVRQEDSSGMAPVKLTVLEPSIEDDRFDKHHVAATEAGDTIGFPVYKLGSCEKMHREFLETQCYMQ